MNDHYLTIVGRAENEKSFIKEIQENIDSAFELNVESVYSLGDFFEVDKKERFILFGFVENEEEEIVNLAGHILRAKSFALNIHSSSKEAIEYAKEKYDFSGDATQQQEKIARVRESFPYFSAEEWEQFQVFDAMYHTGKVVPIRGKLNGELVMVLSGVAHGIDEVRVTPMAIIVNKEVEDNLILPFEAEDE